MNDFYKYKGYDSKGLPNRQLKRQIPSLRMCAQVQSPKKYN